MRLSSEGLGLISREGIWLSFKKDHFEFERIVTLNWDELNDPDRFSEVMLTIGKRKIG